MSTPIEVLFHHGANCNCEQCQRVVKPFQKGKFLSKEEIEQINSDIQGLVSENQKLQTIVDRFMEQQKKLEEKEAEKLVEEEEQKQLKEAEVPSNKNITIVIDTSKLIYIAIIALLVIMILKK
jgi:hypothetical protein